MCIRYRPEDATELSTLRHESEWARLDVALKTSRIKNPAPFVLVLAPKHSDGGSTTGAGGSSINSHNGAVLKVCMRVYVYVRACVRVVFVIISDIRYRIAPL